ncbi:DUF4294 domain-containing protein [Psychroflexus sp. YR1-1]|uniref:DUF4294 domain-containing protein n=2 Tax=Psychroflexus aurantiacus TaxID=2709310 RepID=A0A6B3R401_9FLAO|nr:DUF4294 domain-containing protein [Psychroflexus aurantiacus]
MILDKDSAWVDEVKLDEVIILPKLNFKNRDEFRDYLILKRKTKKVWPYARLASERFEILNQRLENIKSKRKKRKYTLIIQKYVEEEFTEELKKLTKTEGQILVKLIHRQTGETTFDLVKDLRSGWRAFWYNTTASFFNISLKEEYQPSTVKEDFYIEDILQREFQSGSLNKQAPKTDIQFLELMDKWQKDSLLLPPSARRSFGRY